MLACPQCQTPLTPFRLYDRSAMRCLRCRKARLSATLYEWMIDARVRENLSSVIERSREGPGPACPDCRAPTLKVGQLHGSICGRCQSLWIAENKIPSLPLRPKEELAEEAARFEGHDRALASEAAPEDPISDIISSRTGLPFVENVPKVKHLPRVTVTTMLLIVLLTRLAWHDPAWSNVLSLIPAHPQRLGGANFVTYFFAQPNAWALSTHLYFLWLFGTQVEQLVGRVWLLALLMLSTVLGGVLHVMLFHIPLSTASAGVAGLSVFFALAFPYARIGLPILGSWMRFNSWMWIVAWCVSQFLPALIYLNDIPTEFTLYAPVGGAIGGFAFWLSGVWRPASRL